MSSNTLTLRQAKALLKEAGFDGIQLNTPGPDIKAVAAALKDHGVDVIRVVAGQATGRSVPRYDPYFLTYYADRIRNEAGIATVATGNITTVDHANTIVAGGRADLCLLRST